MSGKLANVPKCFKIDACVCEAATFVLAQAQSSYPRPQALPNGQGKLANVVFVLTWYIKLKRICVFIRNRVGFRLHGNSFSARTRRAFRRR